MAPELLQCGSRAASDRKQLMGQDEGFRAGESVGMCSVSEGLFTPVI